MNRKIITRIIGITFTASTLSFSPAMGMDLAKDVFIKAGKAIKAVVADVTLKSADVTGKISDGLDKAAHKLGAKDHNCNNGAVPEVPKTENASPEIPGSSQEKPANQPKTVLPQNITDIIGQLGNEKLCSPEMLELCSFICDEAYKGHVNKDDSSMRVSKKAAKKAVEQILKAKQRQYEFKTVLLCLSLDTYFVNRAFKIWKTNGLQDKIERYTDKYQTETITKIVKYFQSNPNAAEVDPERVIEVSNHWVDYMAAASLISADEAVPLKR